LEKLLIKLGVDFTNIFRAAFVLADPKSLKGKKDTDAYL
jgi:hypothetical protein